MSTTTVAITVIERATVARINDEHQACQRAYGAAVEHAIECGRLLAGVKAQLRHGEFGQWIEEHFTGSQRTAQTYMQLASAPEEKRNAVAGLPLRDARDAIAEPKPKRATASDAGALLQSLGGGSSDRIDLSRERAAATAPGSAWTEPERRKAERAIRMLDDARARVAEAQAASLSRFSVGEIVRAAANETHKASGLLDELAFSFER